MCCQVIFHIIFKIKDSQRYYEALSQPSIPLFMKSTQCVKKKKHLARRLIATRQSIPCALSSDAA